MKWTGERISFYNVSPFLCLYFSGQLLGSELASPGLSIVDSIAARAH
jgi:hypothetical protein